MGCAATAKPSAVTKKALPAESNTGSDTMNESVPYWYVVNLVASVASYTNREESETRYTLLEASTAMPPSTGATPGKYTEFMVAPVAAAIAHTKWSSPMTYSVASSGDTATLDAPEKPNSSDCQRCTPVTASYAITT